MAPQNATIRHVAQKLQMNVFRCSTFKHKKIKAFFRKNQFTTKEIKSLIILFIFLEKAVFSLQGHN